MRINQLQNLCWAGNVLVFAGMAFVGYLFVGAVQTQKDRPEVEWPGGEAAGPLGQTWPPGEAAFKHISATPVNGEVPPPIKKDVVVEIKQDPWRDFKATLKFLSVLEFQSTPSSSTITLEHSGTVRAMRPGQFVTPDWQVIGYSYRSATEESKSSADVVTFCYVKEKTYHDFETTKSVPAAVDSIVSAFEPKLENPISEGLVSETKLEYQTYRLQGDDVYRIPYFEMWWWRSYGEAGFQRAQAVSQPGNDTVKAGVAFGQDLHTHPTLRQERGVLAGDLVVAVNDGPVSRIEDLLAYFQGRVAGATEFQLTVLKDGAERTVKYLIEPGPTDTRSSSNN